MIKTQRQSSAILLASLIVVLITPQVSEAGFLQVYQATGNLHLEVVGAAGFTLPAMGTLTLATIPSGTIKKAYFYATQTNNTTGISASFGGTSLPNAGPYMTEALLTTISTYRWDVTASIIPGLASYSFSITDLAALPIPVPGVALVVVWEDASTEPMRTVTIIDGVKQVGESGAETESMTFTGLPAGGSTVWIFTTDDDTSLGEVVKYNGSNIGGPLIGNLGLNASVLQMSGTSVLGSNTLSISTQTDHFTWVLGATSIDQAPVPTSNSTWGEVKSLFE